MSLRQPVPSGLRPACEAVIPSGAKSASVNDQHLALPKPNPSRIAVIGDTGCRVKGPRVQDCNDPAKWPFEVVAGRAAAAKPDLVIHVGDYLYREDKCPDSSGKLCGGSPSGDRWETWAADFFKPAAKLLASAPWVFARGNHEDCTRSWRGWFYYLDPRPPTRACQVYSRPYVVRLGSFEVAVIDTSFASDTKLTRKQVRVYAAQLKSLDVHDAWLVDHHPFWAMTIVYGDTAPSPLTAPLEAAWEKAKPKGIQLILSGHTHLFEILSFEHGRPPQIVAGDGGTDLAQALPASVNGMTIRGLTVSGSETRHEFGYTLLNKTAKGWSLELKNPADVTLVTCDIEGDHVVFPRIEH
jgi:predicted phosphodiesterase